MDENIFDVIKINTNLELKDIDDEVLVSLAQSDIDLYRHNCEWDCGNCGCVISYNASLAIYNTQYIHNTKCPKCKKPMGLRHNKNEHFHSDHFTELFARYQNKMISESIRCSNIESPDEIYSILSGFFMKIVGKFARDSFFTKKSNKWFSSYFFTSIKNRIADIKKTQNYNKRTPLIKCAICNNFVGQITAKHLMSDGHDVIVDSLIINLGIRLLIDSGEIEYYSENTDLIRDRCCFLADNYTSNMDRNQLETFLKSEVIKIYNELYPGHVTKNNILSTNAIVTSDEDGEVEFESFYSEKNHLYSMDSEKKDLHYVIDELVDKHVKEDMRSLKRFFKKNMSRDRKLEIIKNIIFDKSSYLKVTDKELDTQYQDEVKRGFTSKVMKLIGSKEECKTFLMS